MRALLKEFLDFAGWGALITIALILAVALLEGAGLMMLAPLLNLTALSGGQTVGVSSRIAQVFGIFGLKLTLAPMLMAYIGLIGAHAVLSWKQGIYANELQQNFVDHLRQRLFDSIGAAEWSFLARTHSAEFSHALMSDIGRIDQGAYCLLQIVTVSMMTMIYSGAAMFLSPVLSLLTLTIAALLFVAIRHQHRHALQMGHELTETSQDMYANIADFLSGLKLAKIGNAEKQLSASFADSMREARESSLEFSRKHAATQGLVRVAGAVVLCGLMYGALVILAVPAAAVLALAFIFTRLFPQLSQIQQLYAQCLHALPAYQSYISMCRRCQEAAEPTECGAPFEFSRVIQLEQVSYRPDNSDEDILRKINLTIPAYRTTALVGPSGAGKSTLADLLAGLLAPTEGHLLVDGRVINDRRAWRNRVAYVPQETFLFNTSIRDNLLWSMPKIGDPMLWQALEQAAADFVNVLPSGLDTVIGERGIRLSGGERQRLAIARALLHKPFLLVLDEATSALDHDNELRIKATLSKLHQQLTILVIAHRPATIQEADQVVALHQGRVVRIDRRE